MDELNWGRGGREGVQARIADITPEEMRSFLEGITALFGAILAGDERPRRTVATCMVMVRDAMAPIVAKMSGISTEELYETARKEALTPEADAAMERVVSTYRAIDAEGREEDSEEVVPWT